MPGPAPKHASARARTNKTSTASTLRIDPSVKAPVLPDRVWHPMTEAWWGDIWSSPMAPEFDDSDRHGLFALAMLVDDFWLADTTRERRELAAEIRQQGQRFGLSPIDRRRLQWEIERSDEAQDRGQRRRASREAEVPKRPGKDPRSMLKLA
jgi:hypothetical protein